MKYSAEQVDRLAAEYVLGTLRGRARERFERLSGEQGNVRVAVWRWETYLNGFAAGLEPQQPSAKVWKGIERRIGEPEPRSSRLRGFWQGLVAAVPVAAAIAWLAFILLPVTGFDRVAVFADDSAQTLWVIRTDSGRGVLEAEAISATAAEGDRVYQLWALPQGADPQSLGLLPLQGTSEPTSLSPALLAALAMTDSLAISLEPPGGSPTGLPTGPVVYQAALVNL